MNNNIGITIENDLRKDYYALFERSFSRGNSEKRAWGDFETCHNKCLAGRRFEYL